MIHQTFNFFLHTAHLIRTMFPLHLLEVWSFPLSVFSWHTSEAIANLYHAYVCVSQAECTESNRIKLFHYAQWIFLYSIFHATNITFLREHFRCWSGRSLLQLRPVALSSLFPLALPPNVGGIVASINAMSKIRIVLSWHKHSSTSYFPQKLRTRHHVVA